MQVMINAKYLRSLRHLMGEDFTRPQLNGVAVQADGENVWLIACDGHRLGVYGHKLEECDKGTECEIIIPAEVVKRVKPARHLEMCILSLVEGETYKLDAIDGPALTFGAIEHKFPDWRRVIPQKSSGEPSCYNWEYLHDFDRVAHDGWGAKYSVELYQNGASAAIVKNGCPHFVGVLMPMSNNDPKAQPDLPAWAKPFDPDATVINDAVQS